MYSFISNCHSTLYTNKIDELNIHQKTLKTSFWPVFQLIVEMGILRRIAQYLIEYKKERLFGFIFSYNLCGKEPKYHKSVFASRCHSWKQRRLDSRKGPLVNTKTPVAPVLKIQWSRINWFLRKLNIMSLSSKNYFSFDFCGWKSII